MTRLLSRAGIRPPAPLLSLLLLPLLPGVSPAQWCRPIPVGFRYAADWDALPRLHDRPCLQASSWDRTGGNHDTGNFLRVEKDGEQVLMEAEGPGCVFRIWCTGIYKLGVPATETDRCRWRIWIDGEKKPRLDLSVAELFGLKGKAPFVPPLARTFRSGNGPWEGHASVCYVPIPFQRSIRITGRNLSYYQIDYHLYPKGTKIRSFSLPLTPGEKEALERQARMFARKGEPPSPIPPSEWTSPLGPEGLRLAPGGRLSLSRTGPAVLRGLVLRISPETQETLRGLVLEISWDGNPFPSVRTPLGDFFGAGPWPRNFRALPFGRTREGFYCWFPMPFRKGMVLTLRNDLDRPVKVERLRLALRRLPALPPDTGRFHAAWREEDDIPQGKDFRVLSARGRGKFLGCNLVMQSNPRAPGIYFLEGDEKIYVDGENWPSRYLGTGTEDYFNGAYFWNAVKFEHGPVSGLTFLDWGLRRVCAYRVHFPDDVSFRRSFVMDMEHGPVSDHPSDYAGTAWWYQTPASPAPELPPIPDRFPKTIVPDPLRPPESIALDPGPRALRGSARTLTWREVSPLFTGGRIWELRGPEREGGLFSWTFHVPARERYALTLQFARGPEGGPLQARVDRREGRGLTFSTKAEEILPGFQVELGSLLLRPGPHRILLETRPPFPGRILWTGLSVRPESPFVDRWFLLGPFPNPDHAGFAKDFGPEHSPEGRIDPALPVAGPKGKKLRWIPWKGGRVDLAAALGGGDWRAGYGYARIRARRDLETVLFVGKDDGIRIWLNGRLLLSRNTWSHGTPDRIALPASFRKGENHLLVKCANHFGAWNFCIRPADPGKVLSW